MIVSIIVAIGKNNVIGKNNKLLWHMPADLNYFKMHTKGKPIIMGRKTFESIGKVLPNRENIILTKNDQFKVENATVLHSLTEAKQYLEAKNTPECMVIGGAKLYAEALDIADKLYLTEIDINATGDTYFPVINFTHWIEIGREEHVADASNKYNYRFLVFERIKH